MRNVYSACAVMLPLALGLGLEYLYIMDRLTAPALFAIIAAMVVLITGVPALARVLHDEGADQRRYDNADLLR
jgi:hypothetical protein